MRRFPVDFGGVAGFRVGAGAAFGGEDGLVLGRGFVVGRGWGVRADADGLGLAGRGFGCTVGAFSRGVDGAEEVGMGGVVAGSTETGPWVGGWATRELRAASSRPTITPVATAAKKTSTTVSTIRRMITGRSCRGTRTRARDLLAGGRAAASMGRLATSCWLRRGDRGYRFSVDRTSS